MSAKTDNFINKIAPMATSDMKKTKILASLTISQAILESGWGESTLTVKANNLFGIKAGGSWKGKVFNIDTLEYYDGVNPSTVNASFRVYGSWSESIKDHSDLFLNNSRYSNLIGETDYTRACTKVKQDGYATDPNYTNKLISLIEDYNLSKYDVGGQPSKPSKFPYTVRITADVLNVRSGPGTNYSIATSVKINEVYTIVAESNGWGKLKSGAGWISLEYTVRC